ncbi:MAG: hypothetical protein AAB369_06190, partial [Chloroflexota bacterium]
PATINYSRLNTLITGTDADSVLRRDSDIYVFYGSNDGIFHAVKGGALQKPDGTTLLVTVGPDANVTHATSQMAAWRKTTLRSTALRLPSLRTSGGTPVTATAATRLGMLLIRPTCMSVARMATANGTRYWSVNPVIAALEALSILDRRTVVWVLTYPRTRCSICAFSGPLPWSCVSPGTPPILLCF